IKAKSDTSNTLQGEVSELSFKILPAPQVTAQNNLVSWGSVNDANGYFVTIINGVDSTVVDKKFVVNNTYDVSDFGAGSYSIKVVANGNGTNVLASASSEFVSWNILSNVSLSVANQIVSWTDVGATSYDFVCVANSDDTEIINTSVDSTSYNLSSQYFDAGSYTISVLPKGSGSDFDAKVTNTTITKLADATIEGLSNKKFTINKVTSGISYKIEINKVADAGFEVITLDNMSGNTFTLNDASLNAGEYTAKVFVYGNKANIFDADNDSAVYQFKKLETPTINYSKTTDASGNVVIKIVVGNVDSASSYKLMQNNAQKTTEQEYDISALSAGDYTYTVQAIGNNADVLNSDTTSADKSIKVKKLATPTITFDKTKLEYTINIKEADKLCVENYSFSINGTKLSEVTTANNIVDCSEQMKTATDYTAMAYAVAKIGNKTTLGCDLIIDSESVTYAGVSKISGLSTFKVEFVSENNVQLVVEPTEATALKGTGYKLKLKIGDIELDGFTVKTKTDEESGNVVVEKFTKNIYKAKYDVIEALNEMMAGNADRKVDEHEVSAVISNTNAKIIDSDQYTIPTTFKVLDKVENIVKNGQMIEFDVVENATDYVAVVSLNGVETYIKLDNQYSVKASDDTKNQLSIETLVDLLGATKYKVETAYSIKFVAISDDTSTLANKGTSTFNFKLLKAPDIDIVEQEGSNTKYLSIANNNDNAVQYYLFITYQVGEETKILKEGIYTKTTGNVSELINIDALDGYINAVGKLTIKVCANADTEGEYFNSKYTSTTATKLDVREITVVEGKLQWMADSNAKQYNLTYSLSGTNETKILKLGDANFSIVQKEVDGETIKVCVYDFVDLPSGNTNMLLQVDASIGGGHYLNSNTSSAKAVYKLPTLNINVNAGEVSTVVGYSDILKTSSAEILVDGKRASINIVDYETEQEGLKVSLGWAGVTMSMSPTVLLQYNNMNYETLTIKLYSSDDSTLNSNVATKKIRGLLEPANLDILTSLTTEDGAVTEVVERIVWANPVVNGANVEQYEVVINYNDVNYVYYTTDIGFAMPEYGDTNSNGEKDSGEVDFGAGEYKIKVRALAKTSGNADVTNSKYCAEITITILATPMGLKTQNGNVVWTENSAEYYLARVYLLNSDGTKTLITNASVNENKIDLSSIEFMQTGVYGVTVQSMSNDSKVLASDESDALQIIRLPQVTKYYVDNGELYIRVHKFYTMAEIYLTNITTDETESVTKEPIIISNTDFSEYSAFIGSNDWLDTSITTVLADEDAYIDVKYQNKIDSTLTSLLAEAYTIQVKLYGNSAVKGAIVSGAVSNAYNINLTTVVDEEDVYTNEIVKLATPTTEVSDRTCGQVLLSIPEGTSYNLSYYNDAVEGALEGVHLYQVNITVGTEEHSLLVAEVVDTTKFTIKLIEKNDLKYFIHDGKVFNVIEK
ncbi:MAG: hypothetical protein IJA72_03520, partial [Clostridia bacterium]|nr:hypothetical protein [Clostridia bacterium]